MLLVVGLVSLVVKGGPLYGIDFRGGAVMEVILAGQPPVQRIRSALAAKIRRQRQRHETTGVQEVLIGTEVQDERTLDQAAADDDRDARRDLLRRMCRSSDFNNAGQDSLG